MHGDASSEGLKQRIREGISKGVLPAHWLSHVDRIQMLNMWRPLPFKHNGVEHLHNEGTDLVGVLAFSLGTNWFHDLGGVAPAFL
jgi:hypothetical protein